MKNFLYIFFCIAFFSGCASHVTLLSKDTGKIYQGKIQSDAFENLTLTVKIENQLCSGNFVKFSSYSQRLGKGPTITYGGSYKYKALLACSDGLSLSCFVIGSNSGAGTCTDNHQSTYELTYQ